MSKSMNKVILLGNVGQDPVIRTFGSDKVASFSVATSTGGYKKQDGTEVPEKTLWHNITAWRGLAEITEKYVHKGDKVCVTGSLSYNQSETNGVKRTFTEIVAADIVLLSSKKDADTSADGTAQGSQTAPQTPQQTPASYDAFSGMSEMNAPTDETDDLPF